MSAESAGSLLPVLFKAAAGHVQLTCSIYELASGSNSSPSGEYELLVVDAAQSRGWSTKFSLAAVNTALQDEELSAAELCQVLATVLPCQQAVTAVLQDSGQLRLEAWCHRTQRVPLLPPTQQQRRSDSDYRQAAFCISLPVSQDLTAPGWMQQQRGEAFAGINRGLLAAMLQRDERLQDSVLRLQSQLQLLFSHTAQLQLLAGRAVQAAVRGTTGLKDDPTKAQKQQQQQQGASPLAHKVSTGAGAGAGSGAGAGAVFSTAGLFGSSQHTLHAGAPDAGFALVLGSQVPAGGAGGGIPVQRAGSGGSSRAALGGAAAAGGRAHLARQSQDEKTLRQMWNEQQALAQDWQQRLQQLVGYQGPLESFAQLAQSLGANGAVASARHAVALPWHLGQQQEEEQQQEQEQPSEQHLTQVSQQQEQQQQQPPSQQPEQTETGALALSLLEASVPVGPRLSSRPAVIAAAAGAQGTQQAGGWAGAGAAAHGPISVVAPAKQKQVAGAKRRAHDGQSLLKRGRR